MGWPVAHSLSPRLHGHWLRRYGIDGAYVPLPVLPERLEQALSALPALGFAGANLTIPHKEAAVALVDRLSPAAERIGAVNTVVVEPDGTLSGDNTDGFGFIAALSESGVGWRAEAGPAVLLGAGGAARAVAVALLDAGAPEVRLLNRTPDRARTLAGELGGPIYAVEWAERAAALDGAALLVNTTSLGMRGQPPLVLALDALPRTALVTDVVYTPLITALLAVARARGNPVVDGLGMLLHQARPGFRAWFGVDPVVDDDLRAAVLAGLSATS
jgi:shikimate dehydrogenase